ncbi:hypothetical protein PSPO01_06812 [Paraphaeosphaeria sporulosa]
MAPKASGRALAPRVNNGAGAGLGRFKLRVAELWIGPGIPTGRRTTYLALKADIMVRERGSYRVIAARVQLSKAPGYSTWELQEDLNIDSEHELIMKL